MSEKTPVGQGKKYAWFQTPKGREYIRRHNRNGAQRQARWRAKNYGPEMLEKHRKEEMRRRASPEGKKRIRDSELKRAYGLSLDDFYALVKGQNGCCAICDSELTMGKQTAVDHDHKTGRVRGVLCSKCNMGLGLFGDSDSVLSRAIRYLKEK